MDMWDCEYYSRCQSNSKCSICGPTQRLLKLPGDAKRKSNESKANRYQKGTDAEDSWKEVEQYVADQLNAIPTSKESHREMRSGGIWFLPGDVRDTILTPEVKEREEYAANGEKQFTIKKLWIEKVFEEAKLTGKFPAVIFRFKHDDKAYFIDDFNVLAEMVQTIKFLQEDNAKLTKERDHYKKLAQKYYAQSKEGDNPNGSNL